MHLTEKSSARNKGIFVQTTACQFLSGYAGLISCCFAVFVLSVGVSRAGIIDVFVDTTPIQGTTGALAFDFLDGDGLENNAITISNFVSDAVLSTDVSSGEVTGDLASGPLVLGDGDFFNEWLQNLIFDASFSFRLESTVSGLFLPPDSFSLFLLDSGLLPYATDDPLGTDALLVLGIGNTDPEAQVFASASATATTSRGVIPVPAPMALILEGLTPGVTAANRVASTDRILPGHPQFSLPMDLWLNSLLPGATVTFDIEFINPERKRIHYTPRVFVARDF